MKFILATKQNMLQIFDAEGRVHPATLLSAGPITITQVKDKTKDGYNALQVGYGSQLPKRLSKAVKGHLKNASFKVLREFRLKEPNESRNVGDTLTAGEFSEGDVVTVSSISKGKGFQGVVKRHGFKGGPRSHGQKHSEREPGSVSGGLRTGTRRGMRMAGRMGTDRVTIKNLTVLGVDALNNELLIRGAVPGRRGTLVEIRSV